MAEIYIDGSGWNGERSRYCVYIKRPLLKTIKVESHAPETSNTMEYKALLVALEYAEPGDVIFTDSQLVVGHITGAWHIRAEHLKPLCEQARKLLIEKQVKLVWIPRERNYAGKILEAD